MTLAVIAPGGRRPEHGDLVAQDENLGVLGVVGAGEQGKATEYAEHRLVSGT
jgi:hypothetical protein